MILNLWSEDQDSPVEIYGGGPRECSENIEQHCMYLALTACVLYLFSVLGGSFRITYCGPVDRLNDPPDHFKGDQIQCDTGGRLQELLNIKVHGHVHGVF